MSSRRVVVLSTVALFICFLLCLNPTLNNRNRHSLQYSLTSAAVLHPCSSVASVTALPRDPSILSPHPRAIHGVQHQSSQLNQSELGELEWGLLSTFCCAPVSSNYANAKRWPCIRSPGAQQVDHSPFRRLTPI